MKFLLSNLNLSPYYLNLGIVGSVLYISHCLSISTHKASCFDNESENVR